MRRKPLPVKLFCGLIGRLERMDAAREHLEREFGPVDFETGAEPFTFTDYYGEEMGTDLSRKWISFGILKERAYLVRAKTLSLSVEGTLREAGRRTVNIDPGYVDNAQVVLSTEKNFAHRIYIGKGYYAEVTLVYSDKSFRPLEWTYPDYRSPFALEFFEKMRESYHREMRQRGEC